MVIGWLLVFVSKTHENIELSIHITLFFEYFCLNTSLEFLDESCEDEAKRTLKPSFMRRLGNDEKPLEICLHWTENGTDALDKFQFVLQEYSSGEILVSFNITRIVSRENFCGLGWFIRTEKSYLGASLGPCLGLQ